MNQALYRQSVFFCGWICLSIAWAFWPRYFSRPFSQPNLYVHAHVLPLTLWCFLLFIQAYAIRTGQYWIHRRLAYASYALMPIIVLTTLGLLHRGVQGLQLMEHHWVYFAFHLSTLTAFTALYGLALYHRHDPPTHTRYMLCTALPLFTVFVPRLFEISRPMENLAMMAFGPAAIGQAALIPANALAIAMSVWDWRASRRLNVFPVALGMLLTIHVATTTFYRVPVWRTFVGWFVESW